MGEEPSRGVLVVQPFEYRLEGVETAIEDEHELRSWRLCFSGRHLGFVYASSSRGCGASGMKASWCAATRLVTRDTRAIVTRFGVRPERCQQRFPKKERPSYDVAAPALYVPLRLSGPIAIDKPASQTSHRVHHSALDSLLAPGLSQRISVVTLLIRRFASVPLSTSHPYRNFSLTLGFFG